jgi:uncharacterized membrane protein (UPF0182 family)
MGDLFDDFMRELERRRAEAEGRAPKDDSGGSEEPDPDQPDSDDDGDRADDGAPPEEPAAADDEPSSADHDDEQPAGAAAGRPTSLASRRRRRSGGTPPPNAGARPVGGPDDGAGPPSVRHIVRRAGIGIALIAIFAILVLFAAGINLWTDAIWYKSVGYDSVFWTRLGVQAGLFVGAGLLALIVLLGNLLLANRLTPPVDPERPGRLKTVAGRLADAQRQAERSARLRATGGSFGPFGAAGARSGGGELSFSFDAEDMPDVVPLGTWVIAGVAVLLALGVAGAVTGAWETLLLWIHRVPFSPTQTVVDPIFGRDISFFLFELPFYRLVQSLVNGLLIASLLVAGARYLLATTRGGEVFVTRVRVHLAVLGGLYLLSVAFGYQLDKYELVYSQAGVATGVAFADANARFLAYDVLTFLSGLAGALLIAGAFTRWMWPLAVILIVWFSASIVLGRLYPEAIQRLSVDPNTYAQEEPYIANNISMTRLAFGLDQWQSRSYGGAAPLTEGAIQSEEDTFTNARLWDYRPLQTTLDQLQAVRQYYDFHDVDTDRYLIDGTLRQVMLSGRELAIDKDPDAPNWVNQRVIKTHGIGVAMTPVNEVTPEGQPRLWIRDLPPTSNSGAPEITQPRIYFGESDSHYVVLRAKQPEFDYPSNSNTGEPDPTTSWTGQTGIPLDSTLSRLLFAIRFRDFDLLITDQVQADSQLLFHRTISERLGMVAPFLRFDKDPYLVVVDGKLVYVQDAYTLSDRFPNASSFDTGELGQASGLGSENINYIRNSVKITIDAYDGTMHFYVADPTEPLIRAWQGIFPQLFEPLSQMPAELQAHLRVPEELFNVQTRMYGQYHVTQPVTFFNNTDRWTVPTEQTNQQSLLPEAYYVVMRMPGEPKAEFLLLQPMIARSRPNMIAWVAARNDAPNYGTVRAYQFPADTTIFGPSQIEARIDQDPTISAQISLWNQSGSEVIRGNLIVVPVGDSLIYLQPVYLQSTSSAFPEFQRIVVASPTTVVWGRTLSEALNLLLAAQGGGPGASPSPGPTPTPGPSATPGPTATPRPTLPPGGGLPTDVAGLVEYANTHFELAQAALRSGDFATYGTEMDNVQRALEALGQLTGSPAPSLAP